MTSNKTSKKIKYRITQVRMVYQWWKFQKFLFSWWILKSSADRFPPNCFSPRFDWLPALAFLAPLSAPSDENRTHFSRRYSTKIVRSFQLDESTSHNWCWQRQLNSSRKFSFYSNIRSKLVQWLFVLNIFEGTSIYKNGVFQKQLEWN